MMGCVSKELCPNFNSSSKEPPACYVCNETMFNTTDRYNQTGFGINLAELGYLQSAFVAGYAVSGLACATIVHRVKPFTMIGVCLWLWIIAVIMSGIANTSTRGVDGVVAQHNPNESGNLHWSSNGPYLCMLVGRILSGVGEAATATTALPYLDDVVPPELKGRYFAAYYTAIPAGTALGFLLAGQVTAATGAWGWTYILEAPLMVPFAIMVFFIPYRLRQDSTAVKELNTTATEGSINSAAAMPLLPSESANARLRKSDSLSSQVLGCLSSPVFVCVALGYAGYTAVLGGLSFYGPLYVLNVWNFSQADADFDFGAIVAATGLIGTLIGGWLIDRVSSAVPDHGAVRMVAPTKFMVWQICIGSGLAIGGAFCTSFSAFVLLLALGCIFLFAVSAGVNMVLNWSVSVDHRPMAMSLSVLIIHMLGDVPSPILIGMLSDSFRSKGRVEGAHYTMIITLLWLGWAIIFWFISYLLVARQSRVENRNGTRAPWGRSPYDSL